MTVCFITTHHTFALVLSTACTATQVYMICITVETSTAVQAISVTAVEIRTFVHATIVRHPPASVQIMTIPSLQQLVRSMIVCFITTHTSALVPSIACTATQQCIVSTTGEIETTTNTSTNAGIITVTVLVIRTPVHALVALCPPASVSLKAIALLSLGKLVQLMAVCFIMTHTSALVLSIACTATQQCMISTVEDIKIKTNMNTNAGIITVTAVVIRTPVCATVTLYLPAFVRHSAITSPSLQQLIY